MPEESSMKLAHRVVCSLMFAAGVSASAQPLLDGPINDNEKLPDASYLFERAKDLLPTARTETGKAFLNASELLPKRLRRYMWVDNRFNSAYTEASYNKLESNQKRGLQLRPVTELSYYMGINERPLLDVLPLDLVTSGTELADPVSLAGKKILLYNPRVITQGWLLASLGADVTVLHTQTRMLELYSQTKDVGIVEGVHDFPDGSIELIYADWPNQESTDLGDGFDLIIVSDWLSRGLSLRAQMPPRWTSPGRPLRATESTPDELLSGFAEILSPGGRFITYAYGPMQPRVAAHSQPYSNVRAPYSEAALTDCGLEIFALDMDDSRAVLISSIATDYDEPELNNEGVPTMIAAYTILVKPAVD
jgi:SAM-dependent methyltransferase